MLHEPQHAVRELRLQRGGALQAGGVLELVGLGEGGYPGLEVLGRGQYLVNGTAGAVRRPERYGHRGERRRRGSVQYAGRGDTRAYIRRREHDRQSSASWTYLDFRLVVCSLLRLRLHSFLQVLEARRNHRY